MIEPHSRNRWKSKLGSVKRKPPHGPTPRSACKYELGYCTRARRSSAIRAKCACPGRAAQAHEAVGQRSIPASPAVRRREMQLAFAFASRAVERGWGALRKVACNSGKRGIARLARQRYVAGRSIGQNGRFAQKVDSSAGEPAHRSGNWQSRHGYSKLGSVATVLLPIPPDSVSHSARASTREQRRRGIRGTPHRFHRTAHELCVWRKTPLEQLMRRAGEARTSRFATHREKTRETRFRCARRSDRYSWVKELRRNEKFHVTYGLPRDCDALYQAAYNSVVNFASLRETKLHALASIKRRARLYRGALSLSRVGAES